ncbi:MAG TPA: thiamine-phosphate kinase [Thermoplasmata archaeon]|nr:thiamine-phosphate kinase [Thermoplasmata archaeon]HIH29751.1 thiamine-phosphate kinase [Thermoplasmata archaeon]
MKRLENIGERAAIKHIEKILRKENNSLGIGDDCAAIDLGNKYLLITTDMISQQTHIPPQMTPYQIGWFLVAINLSDLAAKGGTPLGLVCSFGLPKTTTEQYLTELTKGANACAVQYGTTIVGGDTKETTEITLCGTAFGTVKKNEFMPRKGTRPGDIVAVTGRLGKAGRGYYALKRNKKGNKLSKALLEPQPRLQEGHLLALLHTVTSSMDLSDGLSASLYQLQELNAVGFEIEKDALPLASGLNQRFQKKYGVDPYTLALHFGGDYELLVTIPEQKFEKTRQTLQKHVITLSPIGIVTEKKKILLIENKRKKLLQNKGYEHFKKHVF